MLLDFYYAICISDDTMRDINENIEQRISDKSHVVSDRLMLLKLKEYLL